MLDQFKKKQNNFYACCWLCMYKLASWVALFRFPCCICEAKWGRSESGSSFHFFLCFQGPAELHPSNSESHLLCKSRYS